MILTSFTAEHNAVFIVADKLDFDEIELKNVIDLIRETINVHYRDEEEIFFPALDEHLPDIVADMIAAHDRIRSAFEELAGDEETASDVKQWKNVLENMKEHCLDEETRLFDAAEDLLSTEELKRLQSQRKECSCLGHYH